MVNLGNFYCAEPPKPRTKLPQIAGRPTQLFAARDGSEGHGIPIDGRTIEGPSPSGSLALFLSPRLNHLLANIAANIGIDGMKSDLIDAALLIGLASVFFAIVSLIGYFNAPV